MQVWNLLHVARWKCRTQKCRQKSPSGHHRTTLSGYIFAIKARIDNREKKLVKQRYVLHMTPQYGELWPTNGWDPSGSLRHPCKFQRVSRLGSVTARHLVEGVSQTYSWLKLCHPSRPWSIIFLNMSRGCKSGWFLWGLVWFISFSSMVRITIDNTASMYRQA